MVSKSSPHCDKPTLCHRSPLTRRVNGGGGHTQQASPSGGERGGRSGREAQRSTGQTSEAEQQERLHLGRGIWNLPQDISPPTWWTIPVIQSLASWEGQRGTPILFVGCYWNPAVSLFFQGIASPFPCDYSTIPSVFLPARCPSIWLLSSVTSVRDSTLHANPRRSSYQQQCGTWSQFEINCMQPGSWLDYFYALGHQIVGYQKSDRVLGKF